MVSYIICLSQTILFDPNQPNVLIKILLGVLLRPILPCIISLLLLLKDLSPQSTSVAASWLHDFLKWQLCQPQRVLYSVGVCNINNWSAALPRRSLLHYGLPYRRQLCKKENVFRPILNSVVLNSVVHSIQQSRISKQSLCFGLRLLHLLPHAMQIAVRPNGTLDWLRCNLCLCRTVSLNFLRLHFPAQTCAVTSLPVLLLLLLPLVLALLLLLLLLLLPIPCSPNFESQNTRQQGAPPVFHNPILMIFKPWASQSSQLSHLFLQLCL